MLASSFRREREGRIRLPRQRGFHVQIARVPSPRNRVWPDICVTNVDKSHDFSVPTVNREVKRRRIYTRTSEENMRIWKFSSSIFTNWWHTTHTTRTKWVGYEASCSSCFVGCFVSPTFFQDRVSHSLISPQLSSSNLNTIHRLTYVWASMRLPSCMHKYVTTNILGMKLSLKISSRNWFE